MKKLKLNKGSFVGGEVLSREELKNVLGGVDGSGSGSGSGTCCAHYVDGGFDFYDCCLTKDEAQQRALGFAMTFGNGKWCCESCSYDTGC